MGVVEVEDMGGQKLEMRWSEVGDECGQRLETRVGRRWR